MATKKVKLGQTNTEMGEHVHALVTPVTPVTPVRSKAHPSRQQFAVVLLSW